MFVEITNSHSQVQVLSFVTPSRVAYTRENQMLKSKIVELEAERAQQSWENNWSNSDSTISPITSPVVEPSPLRVRSDVYLRSIHKPFDIVAREWVLSLDPKEVVGVKEIGTRYFRLILRWQFKKKKIWLGRMHRWTQLLML
ncbi:uncharacterized protein [Rutidosis leptorrhynchoides]|uniref:uncharacterized protein n=1 Tax=Rutidosis leptorrhynchoides TaxID=125765 RepID=UPI003A99921B